MIGNICNAGDYRVRPMHGFDFLVARGHLLAKHWSYKILVTLNALSFPSNVHAGLRAVLQGLMVAMSVLSPLSCSKF